MVSCAFAAAVVTISAPDIIRTPLTAPINAICAPVALPLCLAGRSVRAPLDAGGAFVIAVTGGSRRGPAALIFYLQASNFAAVVAPGGSAITAIFGTGGRAFTPSVTIIGSRF
ncbi:MAG: hypothetical protein KUG65_11825 [Sphingomonadaceae bacterium]|nr:hypothetical protein [Sphingomonadaceae bacterium]